MRRLRKSGPSRSSSSRQGAATKGRRRTAVDIFRRNGCPGMGSLYLVGSGTGCPERLSRFGAYYELLMPHAGDFAIGSCQATLFTPEADVSAARFLTQLFGHWGARFDAEPTVIPLPEGVPKEVPKIILESRNQLWRCEVASGRVNLFWRRAATEGEGLSLLEFYQTALPMLLEYRTFVASPIRRLAAVVNRLAMHDSPARYLAEHFCRDRWLQAPFNRPENFELHAHKQFQLTEGIAANSWVRSKTAKVVESNRPIVLVEQDLNTLTEEVDRAFTDDEIRCFFETAAVEFDRIIELYFPADMD